MANLAKKDVQELATATGFDVELATLFHSQYCEKATLTEFRDFLQKSKDFDCDPRKGEIYFIKYSESKPGTCFIGKNGFVKNAVAHPQMDGISQGIECDERGHLVSAWCEIHRKDWSRPARVVVYLEEYDSGQGNWKKMPKTMLQKVAVSQACRLAFPDRFSGIFDIAESDSFTAPESTKIDAGVQGIKEKLKSQESPSNEATEATAENPATENDIEKFFAYCHSNGVELTDAEIEEIEPGIDKARMNEIYKIAKDRKATNGAE